MALVLYENRVGKNGSTSYDMNEPEAQLSFEPQNYKARREIIGRSYASRRVQLTVVSFKIASINVGV